MQIKNEAAILLEKHLAELGLKFLREHQFYPSRKWRFDYLLMDGKTAIEIEGGSWIEGRHTRGQGFKDDCEKYRTAAAMEFKVYRFVTEEVLDGTAKEFL